MNTSHRIARAARKSLLVAASPIDRAVLRLNGKQGYPPIALRRQNGPLNTFERVAGEYIGYLVAEAGLAPGSHVLDIGCGSGAMAIQLGERLNDQGRYIGIEVDRATAKWCADHLSEARFSFTHFNYWNATYNPAGGRELPFPVEDGWADVILLKSVFTHMLPEDVAHYLREMRRVLAPGGTALVTAFLYDDAASAAGRHTFPHEGDGYRYANPASPESAIALSGAVFGKMVTAAGLICDVKPGLWRNDPSIRPWAYQDMVFLRSE